MHVNRSRGRLPFPRRLPFLVPIKNERNEVDSSAIGDKRNDSCAAQIVENTATADEKAAPGQPTARREKRVVLLPRIGRVGADAAHLTVHVQVEVAIGGELRDRVGHRPVEKQRGDRLIYPWIQLELHGVVGRQHEDVERVGVLLVEFEVGSNARRIERIVVKRVVGHLDEQGVGQAVGKPNPVLEDTRC